MRVVVRWTFSQNHISGRDQRLASFKRVLRAAQQTRHYHPLLEGAGLGTPEAIANVDSVEAILKRLPPIALEEFRSSPEAFESPAGYRPRPQAFCSPLEHTPRTAILADGFEQTSAVRVFGENSFSRIQRFAADALAAPVGVLRKLAAGIQNGTHAPGPLKHFVVSFTGGHEGELSEADREQFWRTFQVPVFEQRRGFDGRVIAHECEAHSGLHLMPERAMFETMANSEILLTSLTDLRFPTLRVGTRLKASIQHDCCDCGSAVPRLLAA
jgi:hypothetical protein